MAKYDPLEKHLANVSPQTRRVSLTFANINKLLPINDALPRSAYSHDWWWANEGGDSRHVQAAAWGNAGFEADVDRIQQRVTFIRI